MENSIKVLGANGSKSFDLNPSCIQVDYNITIDAGNILKALGNEASHIEHIFLTHSHFDHFLDIPFLLDIFYEKREKPLILYGTKQTLDDVKEFVLNHKIWPDFSKIELFSSKEKSVVFKEFDYGEVFTFDDIKIKVIRNNHAKGSCGFIITKKTNSLLYTSDTFCCESIWEEINKDKTIKNVIFDVSFPSRLENIALRSKHLTPKLLKKELKKLKRYDVTIHANHLKPLYMEEIKKELNELDILRNNGFVLKDLDIINLKTSKVIHSFDSSKKKIEYLNEIGYALTSEKNFDVLLDKILSAAKELTLADAGTIYLMSEDEKRLSFKVVHTDSMLLKMGGTGEKINWPDLELFNENGEKNLNKVSALCALENRLINISDVYSCKNFDFTGPKNFDKATKYRTKSMLVVPLVNIENDVIGVLQLINKKDKNNEIVEFNDEDEKLILSMGSQAAVAISNVKLVKDLERLLNSFIKIIATAIGEKSKYTVGHINRVADITLDIAKAVNEDDEVFKNRFFNTDELKQLDIAAWMHDVGKITTPEYIVDKARKLETIHDRIHLIKAKFEIVKRDLEIEYYKSSVNTSTEEKVILKAKYEEDIKILDEDFEFLEQNNKGSEYTSNKDIKRIEQIAQRTFILGDKEITLLSEDEVLNLSIKKGTLTEEERFIINNHAKISLKMLESLPFPKKLKDVPTIAGGHHEKISGGGYPNNLKGDEISLEARILAIADIFEALTAHDRPYKEPNTLNQSLQILYSMAKDEELDKDLVKMFIEKKIYLSYIKYNLMPSQMDEVTVDVSDL